MTRTDVQPDSDARVSQFALFGQRRFLPLFVVQFLGAFNDQVFKTAFVALLTWRLAREQGYTDLLDVFVQLAAGLLILPFALVSPTAGQIADGMDKARMMRWVQLSELCIMGLAALAFLMESVPFLFAILIATGVQSAFFAPIKYAVLPRYLARHELLAGNALVTAGTFLAIIVGQIVGAKVVLTDGGTWITGILVIGISAASLTASFFAPAVPPVGPKPRVDWVLPRAMVHVLRDCARHREPFFAILCVSWFWFAGATVLSFIPTITAETLHGTEDVALILLVMFSLGVGLGSLVCNVVLGGHITYATVPFGALGISLGLVLLHLGLAGYGAGIDRAGPLLSGMEFLARPDAWPVLGPLLLMSGAAGLYVVPLSVIYQTTSPEAERARFVACSNVVDSLFMVGSAVLAIALVQAGMSRGQVFLVVAATGVIVALVVLRRHLAGPRLTVPAP